MASEDVIELGSSDDEAEPAPKKMKPRLNAMVHIPAKLPEVTIKPTKSKNFQIAPIQSLGRGLTMTRVKSGVKPPIMVNKKPPLKLPITKVVRNPIQTPIGMKFANIKVSSIKEPIKAPTNKVPTGTNAINPMHLVKKLNNTQIKVNKVPTQHTPKPPIRVHNPGTLNKLLPPALTVSRALGVKRPMVTIPSVRKKQKPNSKKTVGEVLTVELDDDDLSQASTSSPQWYLRPEELDKMQESVQNKTGSAVLEKANNAEPIASKMIEITIEDSPVKTVNNKRTHEIGAELAITIDDSPVKTVSEEGRVGSDEENVITAISKTPRSKKKLDYPKETEVPIINTVEIEIEPMESTGCNETIVPDANEASNDIVVEVFESPAKPLETVKISTPKKIKRPQEKPKYSQAATQIQSLTVSEEFHPVYQQFIDLCLKLENSDDMKKIVEKKIKAYYRQVPKEYTESELFIDMVQSKIISMQAGPEKMYLHIKDIVDELNLQRKVAKTHPSKEPKNTGAEKFQFPEDEEFDSKRQRQIRKLEKTIKKLHRAIQKLEEQEVDFDDEEDSVYLLTESDDEGGPSNKDVEKPLEKDRNVLLQRYKERMIRVHAKFCQLTNTKMPSEPRVVFEARPGQPQGPAKRLEKWVNRKVPIGTPLPFPDFHDVVRCVREANEEDKLGWNEVDIMEEARDLFTRCGKKLQRRRQENEWRLAASRISVDVDPAEQDTELKNKLEENKQLATKKETDVFNKYADRQSQLKLEAEEIGDKEAEESSADEDEEEETNGQSSILKDKEKRKERLRKLLQSKSKKSVQEKENKPTAAEKNQSKLDSERVSDDGQENKISAIETEDANIVLENEICEKNNDNNDKCLTANEIVTESSKKESEISEKALSISDDSNKIDSDMDELHLLQKLHSGNEINSTLDSSDTDTPIGISDTLQSSSESKGNQASDVISIENSSYSESETNKDDDFRNKNNVVKPIDVNSVPEVSLVDIQDAEISNESEEPVENNLVASSDEDPVAQQIEYSPDNEVTCVSLQDDAISIGDTVVQGIGSKTTADRDKDIEGDNDDQNKNINDTEMQDKPNVEEEIPTHSSCEYPVIEKPSNDNIFEIKDIFSSFDKNNKESEVAPIKNAEHIEKDIKEADNNMIYGKSSPLNKKVDQMTEITLDSNSPEVQPIESVGKEVHISDMNGCKTSQVSDNIVLERKLDDQTEDIDDKVIDGENLKSNGKLQLEKGEKGTTDTVALTSNVESTISTTELGQSNEPIVAKNFESADSSDLEVKDNIEVSNHTDTLENMLNELQSDLDRCDSLPKA